VASEDLSQSLEERARLTMDRSRSLVRRSAIVVDASQAARDGDSWIPRCASCGKVGVGGEWLRPDAVPGFLRRIVETQMVPGICPDCFDASADGNRRRASVTIHAGGQRAATALAAALAAYPVEMHPDHVLEVDLAREGRPDVNRVLSIVADCLRDEGLDAVHVRLTDRSYTLGGG
jgi:hypothetical protein